MKQLHIYLLIISISGASLGYSQLVTETTKQVIHGHWMLKKHKADNYKNNSPQYRPANGGAYKELILKSNGTYKWKSTSDSSGGDWHLHGDTLGLFMTEQRGQPWNKSIGYDYSWIIVEVDSTKLILKIRGPHGFSYYYYEPSE
jgi:hypothetical protein